MPRVLIVDDDACQLELRGRILEAGGHAVLVAFNASEALRQLGTAEIVIMDLRLPNAKGNPDAVEGLKLIREIHQSGSRAPVIVVSGWPEELATAPEAEFVMKVMVKPVGMAALLAAISAACAPSQSLPSASL